MLPPGVTPRTLKNQFFEFFDKFYDFQMDLFLGYILLNIPLFYPFGAIIGPRNQLYVKSK